MPLFDVLLERMEHIDGLGESNGIDGSIGIARNVLDHFEDACSGESFQRLGLAVLPAKLSQIQGEPHRVFDRLREGPNVLSR